MTDNPPGDMWRVDVAGIPVSVKGRASYEFLQSVNTERARMKMALHRILHMDPQDWGDLGIDKAQEIARAGLGSAL